MDTISVIGSRLDAESLVDSVLDHHLEIVTRWALSEALKAGLPPSEDVIDQVPRAEPLAREGMPQLSVLVCTRERPDDLRRSLHALQACQPQPFEIIVVDNAPVSGKTRQVVEEFPNVRSGASRGRASTGREIAASWTRGVTWSRSSMTTSWSMSVGQACCSRRSLDSRPWVPSPA